MDKKYRYLVTISQDNTYTMEIEANNEEEAREIAFSGDVEPKYKDTLSQDIVAIDLI
jgi:hypothetical protein